MELKYALGKKLAGRAVRKQERLVRHLYRQMRIVLLLWLVGSGCWADEAGLKYFRQIDTQVFAGSKPEKDADFEALRSRGVKFILQAEFLPGMSGRERRQAKKFGMEYLSVPMNASPVAPREKHVNEALRIMRTRQPIYIHCVLGRDRTGLLAGLYRIYFMGASREDAFRLMREDGFRSGLFVHGLKAYFEKHLNIPAELMPLR